LSGQSSVCCLVELGRADESDDYIIFRWEWRRWVMNHGHFPVISLLFPVPDAAISAEVIVYTHFFADFGCFPAPFTGIYRQGKPGVQHGPTNPAATAKAYTGRTQYGKGVTPLPLVARHLNT